MSVASCISRFCQTPPPPHWQTPNSAAFGFTAPLRYYGPQTAEKYDPAAVHFPAVKVAKLNIMTPGVIGNPFLTKRALPDSRYQSRCQQRIILARPGGGDGGGYESW